MRKLRQSRAHLMTIVAVVIAAWLVASNHCALATLASEPDDHACCHSEKGETTPAHDVQCCDSLTVPTPENAVAPVVHLTELMPAWQPASFFLSSDLLPELLEVPAPNTGPPGSESFAILVLNRSLLAHAPPVFIV